MKKLAAMMFLFAAILVPAYAFAVDFDGSGSTASSTLDAPEASEGTDPYQGNFSAEANS
jgi:hypothetical protein